MKEDETKILVIGLDGADLQLIESWRDKLPNLRKIQESGVYGISKSTIPPVTCPAWNCFTTGKNPAKIGVFDFQRDQFDVRSAPKILTSTDQDSLSIWELLSDNNRKVGVFNVPATYPPQEVNGFMVSGFLTPIDRRDFTYPVELAEELNSICNGYQIDRDIIFPQYHKRKEKGFLEECHQLFHQEVVAAKYLMKKYDWDFYMVVFRILDLTQHHLWHHMDPSHPLHDKEKAQEYGNTIQECYREADSVIGDLIEIAGDDATVLVVSDHGFGPLFGQFFVNRWLAKNGMLRPSQSIDNRIKAFVNKYLLTPGFVKILTKLGIVELLAYERLRQKKEWIARVISIHEPRDQFVKSRAYLGIDWSRTKAYGYGYGRIYINLEGRESKGIVKLGEDYNRLRDKIIEMLLEIRHPETGNKVVDQIYKKEELYWGKHLNKAPDLVFSIDNIKYTQAIEVGGEELWKIPVFRTGEHRVDGVWMMTGPSVKKNMRIDVGIMDFAPTILYLLRVPIPRDMDGKVIREALTTKREVEIGDYEEKAKKAFRFSRKEDEELRRRLKGLGYIA